MELFSDYNLILHKKYLEKLKLKYSILIKSEKGLDGVGLSEIYRCSLPRSIKDEAYPLLFEIALHEAFFSSFSDTMFESSKPVKEHYGTEANFCNQVYKACMKYPCGFVYIGVSSGKPSIFYSGVDFMKKSRAKPHLAIDISEHAYYGDYQFKKEEYLKVAIPRLHLSLLEQIEKV